MKRILTILYIKYALGQCKHSCLFCKFRNECLDNLEYEYDHLVPKRLTKSNKGIKEISAQLCK